MQAHDVVAQTITSSFLPNLLLLFYQVSSFMFSLFVLFLRKNNCICWYKYQGNAYFSYLSFLLTFFDFPLNTIKLKIFSHLCFQTHRLTETAACNTHSWLQILFPFLFSCLKSISFYIFWLCHLNYQCQPITEDFQVETLDTSQCLFHCSVNIAWSIEHSLCSLEY